MPRRVRQGLTLWLIVIGSCAWWYVDTGSMVFLAAALVCVFAGLFQLRHDLKAIRSGISDAQGFTTVVGKLTKREEAVLLFLFAFTPLAHRAYLALSARAVIPPQPHDIVIVLPAWFTFAAGTISFAAWVVERKEKWFWITATAFPLTYGLWQLAVSGSAQPLLSQTLWNVNTVSALLLAVSAYRLYKSQKTLARHPD